MIKAIVKYLIISYYILLKEKKNRKQSAFILLIVLLIGFLFFEYKLTGEINPISKILHFSGGYELSGVMVVYLVVFFYLLLNVIYLLGILSEDTQTETSIKLPEPKEQEVSKTRQITKTSLVFDEPSKIMYEEKEGESSTNQNKYTFEIESIKGVFLKSLFSEGSAVTTTSTKKDKFNPELNEILASKYLNKL